jgi:hypothetical protein
MNTVGLQNSEHADICRRRFRNKETDPVSFFAARFLEESRQSVGVFLQLAIVDPLLIHNKSKRIRAAFRLLSYPMLK